MNTGYFAMMKRYSGLIPVSIALYTPKAIKIREYPALCPSPYLLVNFKTGFCSQREYIDIFTSQLSKLDPHKVFEDLGENTVLLCYEKAGDFCHRRLVAVWLEKELGIEVNEA